MVFISEIPKGIGIAINLVLANQSGIGSSIQFWGDIHYAGQFGIYKRNYTRSSERKKIPNKKARLPGRDHEIKGGQADDDIQCIGDIAPFGEDEARFFLNINGVERFQDDVEFGFIILEQDFKVEDFYFLPFGGGVNEAFFHIHAIVEAASFRQIVGEALTGFKGVGAGISDRTQNIYFKGVVGGDKDTDFGIDDIICKFFLQERSELFTGYTQDTDFTDEGEGHLSVGGNNGTDV